MSTIRSTFVFVLMVGLVAQGKAQTPPGTGNTAVSAAVSVSVVNADTVAPTVSVTNPIGGSTVSGTITVSANAADNIGVVGVQFKLDGVNLGAEDTTSPYSSSWNTVSGTNAPHAITAVARDAAGNQVSSAAVSATVLNQDSILPTVSITGPAGGSTVSGTVTVSATAADNIGVAGVQFKLDGVNLGAEDTTSPYSGSWNTAAGTNASHVLTAVARDAAGNQKVSAAVSATVLNTDTIAPTVSISTPAGSSTVSGTVTVNAVASDNVAVLGVQFKLDGVNIGAEDTTSPYSSSWDTSGASNASHVLTAVARDAGRQTVSAAVPVTVNNASALSTSYSLENNGGATQSASQESTDLQIGSVKVQPDQGNMTPEGVAIFGYRAVNIFGNNPEGVLVTEAGVPASAPLRSGRLYARIGDGINTGVAFANSSAVAATISYHFTKKNGTDVSTGVLTLAAHQQISTFMSEAPFNAPVPFEGTFTFTSSTPVAAIALQGLANERSEFLITTLPVSSMDNAPVTGLQVLPHFADGKGWSTDVVLTNPTDATLNGTVQFYGQTTTSAPAVALKLSVNGASNTVFNYVISPRSSTRLTTGNPAAKLQVGSVRVTPTASTTAPSALAIFSFKPNGITVSQTSIAAAPLAPAFRLFVEAQGAPDQVGSLQAAVAVANPSASPLVVDLELSNLDGTAVGPKMPMTVPANAQAARFIRELFPTLPAAFQGMLRVSSPSPFAMAGVRTRYNERGEFLISTTPASAENASAPAELVFPHVVVGAGYSTQLVLFGSTPGKLTGKLFFRSQDGTLLQIPR